MKIAKMNNSQCIGQFLIIYISMEILTLVQSEYLFRVSPGGDGYKTAGLWGGILDLNHEGQGSDLYSHGYNSLNTSYKTFYGIEMEYVSYDPISKRVLMIVDEPDGSLTSTKHSMALGPLCKEDCAPLDATFQNFRLTDENNPFLMDQDCGWKCGWGPFAYYNSKTYFALSAVHGTRYDKLLRQIQIRVLDGCEDIIESIKRQGGSGTVSNFPVLQCSILIKTIHQAKYTKPNPRPKVWVTKDLKIIDEGNSNIHFFLQMINIFGSSTRLEVVHVHNSNMHTLHSETIHDLYAGNTKVRGLGSIDFKHGYLCWTAAEKLICSMYDLRGNMGTPTSVLSGVDAIENGICQTDNLPQEVLQRTLTGLAISDTQESLSIYFGCYADIPSTGGIGLLQLSNHGLTKQIYQVKSGSHRIYGGNLFLSNTVDIGCKYYANSGDDPPLSVPDPSHDLASSTYFSTDKTSGDIQCPNSLPVSLGASTTCASLVSVYLIPLLILYIF